MEIDSRTSDALALAVRFNCPIYTYEFILDAAGVVLEDPEETPQAAGENVSGGKSKGNSLSSYSIDALNKMLDEVLTDEDYERAAEIRDELKRRKAEEG